MLRQSTWATKWRDQSHSRTQPYQYVVEKQSETEIMLKKTHKYRRDSGDENRNVQN